MKNIELEKALLGCILQDPSQMNVVKSWVPSHDFFYSDFNQRVWLALVKLDKTNEDIDLNTVADAINVVDTDYSPLYEITGFVDLVISPKKSEGYAKLLHSDWLRRKLDKQIHVLSKTIHDDSKETQVILEDAHTTIGNIINLQPAKKFDMISLLGKTMDSIFNATTLINTGIAPLDKVVTGMTRGEITIIAGRPGSCKTSVSANIARNLVHQGKKVVMFNREMPNTEMMKKFMAMECSDINYSNLRSNIGLKNESIARASNIISELYDGMLYMFDDIRDMEGTFREIKSINPDVVIDDHIGLIEHDPKDRRDLRHKIGDVTRGYKWLAKAQNMSVILVSQMNRNVEHRNDRVPRLSDLAESGNLEQDAEIVVFTHYPWVSRYGDDGNSECYLQLIVAKNRYGNTNLCEVGYYGNSCLVTNSEGEAVSKANSAGSGIKGSPF
tara:strand:- start:13 stop:1338 length:1326 start_codon:yes stop_codon:yes gene_type:complete